MTEVSKLYSSVDNIYQTKSRADTTKGEHGDVKHIVFKDGIPIKTEIIRVKRKKERETVPGSKENRAGTRSRISAPQPRQSDEAVLETRRKKLADRLKTAIQHSQTLWSEKQGIWLSYQGNQGFLVKQFSPKNQLLSKTVMTQAELMESSMPGLLEANWRVL
ncbi:MAG: hypothetical protein ABIK68_15955 [bacterium]